MLQNRYGWQAKLKEIYKTKRDENKNNIDQEMSVSDNNSSSLVKSGLQMKIFKVKIPYNLYKTIFPEMCLYKDGTNKKLWGFKAIYVDRCSKWCLDKYPLPYL